MCDVGQGGEPPGLGSGVQENGDWYFRLLYTCMGKGSLVREQLVFAFPDPHLGLSWQRTRTPHEMLAAR